MSDETTTQCPTCGGIGQDMHEGRLVRCDDCDGAGRVPAVLAYPTAAYVNAEWSGSPDLLPIPKEYRHE